MFRDLLDTILRTLEQQNLGAFTQEIVVLTVFFVSCAAWRCLKMPSKSAKPASSSPIPVVRKFASAALSIPRISDTALPTVRAAEQQMLRHLEQREFTRALNMYRTLERDGKDQYFSEELFASFIQSAIRVGKVDVVERMLRSMKRNCKPSLQFWQTTMKMLSSRKHFAACLSAHAYFGKAIPCDRTVYSCLINAALEMGVPDRASAMLERYAESGIDAKDYVLFFRTYVAMNDTDAAEACFQKLGTQVTTLMVNLLLLICINVKDPVRAHRILQESHRLEQGEPKTKLVDAVSYNTVIKGFAQAGQPTKCFDLLHEMLEHCVDPDDVTFGTLLDACIVDNDIGAAKEVVKLLMGRTKPLDTVMSTLFMKALVRANCLPKALELYEEMKTREGARPDIVTYSVLIKALVDQHDLDRALQLVEDMKSAGLVPDDIILTHLLEGCRHAGLHSLGKKLFDDMLELGVRPSDFTLVTMLKLHGRCGAHQEAHDLVSTWEEKYHTKPSVIHYTCIMSGCLRTKKFDLAWAAYELMYERGIALDSTAVTTLLPSLVSGQQWERVLILAARALSGPRSVHVPVEVLNNALSQMITAGAKTHQIEQLQQLMKDAGVSIAARIARRL